MAGAVVDRGLLVPLRLVLLDGLEALEGLK